MARRGNSLVRFLRGHTRTIGLRRAVLTILLLAAALLVSRHAWQIPLIVDAERALYDVRVFALAPRVDQDDRIVLITYTDETLAATGRRSPLDRGLLATALARLDSMQPRSIGIDILIDQPQAEDDALRAVLGAMQTPTYIAFANATTNEDSVKLWQEEFQRNFQAGLGDTVRPASIRLETDGDNVVRSWPSRPLGDPPILADLMAGEEASGLEENNSIAFRIPENPDRPLFASIPIDLLDTDIGARMLTNAIAGRHVLVGADINDVDQFDTPMTRLTARPMTGLQVHATLLAQNLDAARQATLPSHLLWLMAVLVVTSAALRGFGVFGVWNTPILIFGLCAVTATPFALQAAGADTQTVPAFGWIAGWILGSGAVSAAARGVGAEQRKFAQSALGRYLPPEIARAIIKDPDRLKLTGERRVIVALFSDIEGFTTLTHAIEPERTAALLNAYLDRISKVVLEHGGTIDKFVGDSVVAFWGAPLARESDGENAVKAAIAIARAGDDFTRASAEDDVAMGRTRVGVHRGEAIVGNLGGDGRIQYTALGDVMNTAARLEGANKTLGTQVLVSAAAAEGLTGINLRPLGRVQVRGRAEAVFVFDAPAVPVPGEAEMIGALIERFDTGEPDALAELETYAERRASDPALASLVQRLKSAGPGGCYALD